jgi:Tol biopolymer transport system component
MTPERWREIADIYGAALERPKSLRASFVAEACTGDDELRREVLSLLQYESASENFLRRPAELSDGDVSSASSLIGIELGSYRIQSLLGIGGMGAVYSAYDPRLERTVAIKVLPATFAVDAERLQRFEREARAAAALNHPNILSVYDVGRYEGRPFIVMELVPGETLASHLQHGRVPIARALEIGSEIADALAAAHDSGVVHRDLKPSNVMVMPTGRVKVLDFGLAKMLGSEPTPADDSTSMRTQPGRLLGTPAYMSPERLRGQTGDYRADIFSLGVMVFELLTGRRPFDGSDLLALVSNVLTQAPPLASDLEPAVPVQVAEFIALMLSKEPMERPETAALVKTELERLGLDLRPMTSSDVQAKKVAPPRARTRTVVRWLQHDATIVLGALFATVVFLEYVFVGAPTSSLASHRQITFVGDAAHPAISRDGQFLAYVVGPDGDQKVMVQDLASGHAREALKGRRFFDLRWSPDGANILAAGVGIGDDKLPQELHLIPRFGGAPRRLPGGSRVAWSPDGSQIVSVYFAASSLHLTDVETGAIRSTALTVPVMALMQVDWAPSGKWLLLVALNEAQQESLWIVRPDGTEQQQLHEEKTGTLRARWGPAGDVIYYLRGQQTQELWKLSLTNRLPALLLTGLEAGEFFDIPRDGKRLAYTRSSGHANLWLATFKRAGTTPSVESKQLSTGTLTHSGPRISPDGTRVAFSRGDSTVSNIFVLPIDGGSPQQLTFLKSQNQGPVWSPDGRTIAFASTEGGTAKVWQVPADGGTPQALSNTRVSPNTFMLEWAPGADILYHRPGNRNFSILNSVTGAEVLLLRDERIGWFFSPRYSPDGKEIVATWNQGDRLGVYVMTLQGPLLNDERPYRLVAGKPGFGTFGTIAQQVDVAPYRGKDFKLTVHVRTTGEGNAGQCRLRKDRSTSPTGFFDNMQIRPITGPSWGIYEIAGKIDANAEHILFECFLRGTGELWLDELQLFFKDGANAWTPIEIRNPGFEDDDVGAQPSAWRASSPGYMYQVRTQDPFKGQKSLLISSIPVSPDAYWPIGWSADGSSIFAIDAQKNEIVTIPARGGIATSFGRLGSQDKRLREAAITPDGHRMIYTAPEGRSDVWIVENFDSSVR